MRAALAAVALSVTIALERLGWAQADVPPPDFTILFLGDQGSGPAARAVLMLIRNEGARAVRHRGRPELFSRAVSRAIEELELPPPGRGRR